MQSLTRIVCLSVILAISSASMAAPPKLVDGFEDIGWSIDPYSKGAVKLALRDDVPAAIKDRSNRSMEYQISFDGNGFAWASVAPASPLVIPGEARKISLWAKGNSDAYPLIVTFRDGWGREQAGGKKLEWAVKTTADWKQFTFSIPADWVFPIAINALTVHNWERQQAVATVKFAVDQLEVETDLANVDMATGRLKTWQPNPQPKDPKANTQPESPLFSLQVRGDQLSNVFADGEPVFHISARSWLPEQVEGKLSWSVRDHSGAVVKTDGMALSVSDLIARDLRLEIPRFGLYQLQAEFVRSDGQKQSFSLPFAKLPPQPKLTEEQKLASPYGLNVHGGRAVLVSPYTKAGIVWFRDYAFAISMMRQARGADGQFNGWPYPRTLAKKYTDNGGKLLACLQGSIPDYSVEDAKAGKVAGPSGEWSREIASFILAFPEITWWELDNEYDYRKGSNAGEKLTGWKNYGAYHRKFADIVRLLGDGKLAAVEQGRAGIWPDRVAMGIKSGDFDHIAVINSHYYTGIDPPETNIGNFNSGGEDDPLRQEPATFFDQLRAAAAAGRSDGKPRQHWLTEVGWDTLAGNIVSPYEQAVYLARCYMLTMAAGTEKAFWFFDVDSPKPAVFFDGCGLLNHEFYPKLSLCSLAGLTCILPNPKFVGTIEAGENTCGYVFEQSGKLVASLWSLTSDKGPTITFATEQLYDFLGNKLAGKSVALSRAPVYAVGLDRADALYRQTAYSLKSRQFVNACAGDTLEVAADVTNNRATAIDATLALALPEGWTTAEARQRLGAAPGETKSVTLRCTVNPNESSGEKLIRLVVSESQPLKTVPIRINLRPALSMQVAALSGKAGATKVDIHLFNQLSRPIAGQLRLRLPGTWSTPKTSIDVPELKPSAQQTIAVPLTWATQWKVDEKAEIEFADAAGLSLRKPILPSQYVLHAAKDIKIDGDLSDWPAETRWPEWMLGCSRGAGDARIHLAWSKDGLYVAADVQDSAAIVADPRAFWGGDCLELFLSTRGKGRTDQWQAGDHQFWLVPLPDENRVYVGQWKRKSEIAETKYDIKGIKSAARKTAGGYIFECLIPASMISGFDPKAGAALGLNMNLSVRTKSLERAVYWPNPKSPATMDRPSAWGTVYLE